MNLRESAKMPILLLAFVEKTRSLPTPNPPTGNLVAEATEDITSGRVEAITLFLSQAGRIALQ
jgi:hypothetical protein